MNTQFTTVSFENSTQNTVQTVPDMFALLCRGNTVCTSSRVRSHVICFFLFGLTKIPPGPGDIFTSLLFFEF